MGLDSLFIIVSIRESTFRTYLVLVDRLLGRSYNKSDMHVYSRRHLVCLFVGHTCLAVYDSSVAWQPGCACLLIHMILFGIDRAVFYPLPFSSLCPPSLLLSSWTVPKLEL